MNVTKNQIDELNLQLTLTVAPEDYSAEEKKILSQSRRTADIKGFRKGMAPMSLIQRLYGDRALMESVNKCISEGLTDYIKENDLQVIGEPLSSEDQPQIEWKSGNEFAFKFDLGLSSKVDFDITAEDKVPYYQIEITDIAKSEMKENMLKQFGGLQEAETAGEDDFVMADLTNGEVSVESAYIAIRKVEGAAHESFVGCKAGEEFEVNVNEAFTDETDRASMLKLKKEDLAALNPSFKVKVVNVKTFVPAEENQETYDKLFGADKVHNSEEFDAAIEQRLSDDYKQEADYRLSKDIREYLMNKANVALPEDFLKRWLFNVNEGKFTKEQIEKEFPEFLVDFRWQMIRDFLMKKYALKVEEKDLKEAALAYVSYQYAMYGMGNVPQDLLENAAQQVLSDEKQSRNIYDNVEVQKVIGAVKGAISFDPKKISVEDFRVL